MTRDRLLRETSSRELLEWEVLYDCDPFGDRRADYHAAQIVSALATRDGAKDLKLEDLVLAFQTEEREPQSVAFIETSMRQWVASHNAALKRKAEREAREASRPRRPYAAKRPKSPK